STYYFCHYPLVLLNVHFASYIKLVSFNVSPAIVLNNDWFNVLQLCLVASSVGASFVNIRFQLSSLPGPWGPDHLTLNFNEIRQLGAYFCLLINDPQNPPSSTRLASFEAFTHLASILPVYLNLETCPPALNISTVQIERGLRPADLFNGLKRLIGLAQPSNQSGSPSDTTAGVSELAVTETPSQLKCPTISPEIVTDKPSSNPTALLAGI
ncbi:unnamed protein product, partial [Protopolystoma xenopodis]